MIYLTLGLLSFAVGILFGSEIVRIKPKRKKEYKTPTQTEKERREVKKALEDYEAIMTFTGDTRKEDINT